MTDISPQGAESVKLSVIEAATEIAPASPISEILRQRAEIMQLTEASHDAVLTPREPGGLTHAERASLACRMARLCGDARLAAHYAAMLAATGSSNILESIASTEEEASELDQRLAAIVRHVDLLTSEPKRARRDDIEALKRAGVSEPDIVRLAELAAFVSYQARVIAGLRLLKDL
jgi:CMD domain protein